MNSRSRRPSSGCRRRFRPSCRPRTSCRAQIAAKSALPVARFQARRSRRRPATCAGNGSQLSRTRPRRGDSDAEAGSATGGACPARRKRWARSAGTSWGAGEIPARTWGETRMSRPCSSQVYQVRPTPARSATSSRRRPGVRRRWPLWSPTVAGEMRALRLLRKPLSSGRASGPAASGKTSPSSTLAATSTTKSMLITVPNTADTLEASSTAC